MSLSNEELRALVSEFRNAWKSATEPGIEAFLARHESLWKNDAEVRHRLLRGLLPVELRKRYADGSTWDRDEYDSRFPDDADLLDELFAAEPNKTSAQAASTSAWLPPFREGAQVGPYVLAKRLGSGGMGEVWSAECRESGHRLCGRHVALKLFNPALHQADGYELIRNEIGGIADLDHPHIVKLLDTHFPEGAATGGDNPLYLAFELIAGAKTLRSVIKGLRPSAKHVSRLMAAITQAVAYAHNKNIYHHDIKPDNVLMDGEEPKLTDFGLAHRLGDPDQYPTGGTPHYMSPERRRGEDHLYGAPDVWSLGVILYELLTGERPFTPEQVVDDAFRYRPVTEINPDAHSKLVDLVSRCLDRNVDSRITASELARELQALHAELPGSGSTPADRPPGPQVEQPTRLVSDDDTQLLPEKRNLPQNSLGELFIGREAFLDDLRSRLLSEDHAIRAIIAPQPIYGLGGLGKTQLAIEYAWRFGKHYSAILFVTADNPENFQQNLAGLCGVLKIEAEGLRDEEVKAEEALRWLREHRDWLLIVDNVDDEQFAGQVEQTLANLTPNGHILITSRLANWQSGVEPLELSVLAREDAASLLLAWTSQRKRRADDEEQALLLADDLDGLALAVRQAASFINRQKTISIADYRARWKQQDAKVVEWENVRDLKYPRSVATTWQVTIDKLHEPAKQLLETLAWLAPAPVPDWLFETGSRQYEDALAELAAYSLVTSEQEDGQDAFRIHRLVQEITRFRTPQDERTANIETALQLLNSLELGDPTDVRTWPRWNPIRPHVSSVLASCHQAGVEQPATRLMNDLALLLNQKCLFSDAEELYRRALAIDEQSYGAEHPDVAIDLNNLAQLLQATNRLAEAEPLMRRAVDIFRQSFGEEHPNTQTVEQNLRLLLDAMKD